MFLYGTLVTIVPALHLVSLVPVGVSVGDRVQYVLLSVCSLLSCVISTLSPVGMCLCISHSTIPSRSSLIHVFNPCTAIFLVII